MSFGPFGGLLRNPRLAGMGRDALLAMQPETAHKATINALKWGLSPTQEHPDPAQLATRLAGLDLPNPLGMAAGFDKNAEVPQQLLDIGFGFAEAGTVTPLAQPGNPQPRVFRLPNQKAVINRLGFNNDGHAATRNRLRAHPPKGVFGVNIGANKQSDDFVADYVAGVKTFASVARYLTVNISSPNTPGLRGLQAGEALARLLDAVLEARQGTGEQTPIFLKLAPDLHEHEMNAIAGVVARVAPDGLIVSNTTVTRPGVESQPQAGETGGLSGAPLFALSTQRLAQMRQRVGPDLPIIGVGGVHSSASALAKFRAGANAIQLYTGLIYEGFGLIAEIKAGLLKAIRENGGDNPGILVGAETDLWARGEGRL